MRSTGTSEGLAQLRAGLDALLRTDALTGLDDDEVLEVVRECELARRRLSSVDHATVTELEVRSVPARFRHRSAAGVLTEVLGIDLAEARERVRRAAELGPRTAMNGDPVEPVLPATAAAQSRGELSDRHAAVISRAVRDLPRFVEPEVRSAVEAELAERGAQLLPTELRALAERIAAHLDPDGSLTDDADRARRRSFTVGPQGADGMSRVSGQLDPACRALLDAAFVSLAKPTPAGSVRDPRSAGQRQHDALAAVCELALGADTVGSAHGSPAEVVVTVGLDDLERRAGRATTATGVRLTVPELLDLARDGSWALAVMSGEGHPLWLGRGQRLASPAQRRALAARDGGCTRPGCDIPAAWCQAHHLVPWAEGGRTDVDAMVTVCEFDHRLADEGWTITLDPATATVEWTPPPWLDPTRTPRVNQLRRPSRTPRGRPRLSTRPGRAGAVRRTRPSTAPEAAEPP
ncbi:HNH endonuclease signature motif containing protein [Rhodococcus aerolatus]